MPRIGEIGARLDAETECIEVQVSYEERVQARKDEIEPLKDDVEALQTREGP